MDSPFPSPLEVPTASPLSGQETEGTDGSGGVSDEKLCLETKGANGPGSVSDEEGFVSGDEEFQVAPESLPSLISDDPFAPSTDISKPTDECLELSGAKVHDEDTHGEKVFEEDDVGNLNVQSKGFHDLDASISVDGDTGHATFGTRQLKGDNGGGGIEGVGDSKTSLADDGEKPEKNGELADVVDLVNRKPSYADAVQLSIDDTLVSKQLKEGSGDGVLSKFGEHEVNQEDAGTVSEEAVKENDAAVKESYDNDDKNEDESIVVKPDVVEVDGVKVTPEGDAVDAVKVPGIAVNEVASVEPAEVERELPADVAVVANGNTDEANQEEKKSVEPDVVEVEGVKLTPEGNSIVDAIDADVKVPGVAVVGKADLPKVEEEIPEDVPVVATDNTEEGNEQDVRTIESDAVKVDGVRLTAEGDSVVDAINADVKIPGIAVFGRSEECEPMKVEDELHVDGPLTLDSVSSAEPGNNEKLDPKGDVQSSTIVHDTEMMGIENIEETSESIETESSDKIETGLELSGTANVKDSDVVVHACDPDEHQLPGTNQSLFVDDDAVDIVEAEHAMKNQITEEADYHGSDEETDGLIFGSSEAAKQFIEQLEQGAGSDVPHRNLQRIDGQVVTDSDEEVDTDEDDDEGEAKELLDPSALAALLKAATGADADVGGGGGGGITITSQDGTRLLSVERPAGLGSSLGAIRPNSRQTPLNLSAPTTITDSVESKVTLSDEEKIKFEKLQQIRVKYLRLIHRLGLSSDDSVPAQVLYRLMLIMGRQGSRVYTLDAAKTIALQLEAEEGNDLDLSLNILVLGKCGVGKSATINSIFGEKKAQIDAFQPATNGVREIVGYVNGVKLRVFDTPGLKCSLYEQSFNCSILASIKRATKKHPLDAVLYVDRMDSQTKDMNDVPLLKAISSSLGSSIWKMSILTLTHAASAPPDDPSGSPLSYDIFTIQRSHVLQQTVSSAAGETRMMNPSPHPVALVENHPSCRKNREGHKVLPNGQSWRPQLLLLCFSFKILSEVNLISKPQDAFDHHKYFGFRGRAPPLPYMLSSMLQSHAHPKLPNDQGIDNGDSDIDLDYFSDTDQDEEDEYDQLPPFKPLKKAQVAKLSKEQKRAYFEEYEYRVKLLQKKQLKDELKRMKEMKNRGKNATVDFADMVEDGDSGAAAPVAVPLPDMVLPPSFDSDNPAYRYRFLEPTSQFLARPVLDSHGWDHDFGYDGVNVEQGLAIVDRFPAAVTFQITKDKKDFTISLDSSVSAKHGENGSTMAGFDIQSIGKQLAYTLRGETKFKNLKKNKTSGGISVTFLGDNVVTGAKLEDQITLWKQYVLVGSAGAVGCDRDTAYGANFELQRRETDFPVGQAQSTISMSLIKWRGDLALGFNTLFQFSVGRGSKVAIRAGINNKRSGQVTVKTSSSEHLSLALTALIPIVASIYKKLQPSAPDQYALY